MSKPHRVTSLTIGLAIFSMFFGAGNIVFPIALGTFAGDKNIFAFAGLSITAILVPFLTLMTLLMYNGDYKKFFSQIGAVPGAIIAFLIMCLIGPFGALPRCITASYATLSIYNHNISALTFGLISTILIFVLAYKKSLVVEILGKILTPLLLLSLLIIIARGFYSHPVPHHMEDSAASIFFIGLSEGYKTMDFFAGFFFSILIIPAFKIILGDNLVKQPKNVAKLTLKSSGLGIVLLGTIYAGMSFVASYYRDIINGVPTEKQLGVIANHMLGPYAGIVANTAVSIACLTTAITLAVVFAEYVRNDILNEKVGYTPLLIVTLLISFYFYSLGFSGIMQMVIPALLLLCPAMIVLVLASLAHRFFGFQYIKVPFYVTLVANAIYLYLI